MTYDKLSQLYWLKKRIKEINSRISELEEYKPSVISEFKNKYNDDIIIDSLGLCEAELADERDEALKEIRKMQLFIDDIPDPHTKRLFIMKFSDGMTYEKISSELDMLNGENSLRQRIFDYIDFANGRYTT